MANIKRPNSILMYILFALFLGFVAFLRAMNLPDNVIIQIVVLVCLLSLGLILFGSKKKEFKSARSKGNKGLLAFFSDRLFLLAAGLGLGGAFVFYMLSKEFLSPALHKTLLYVIIFLIAFLASYKFPFRIFYKKHVLYGALANSVVLVLLAAVADKVNLLSFGSRLPAFLGVVEIFIYSLILELYNNPMPLKYLKPLMKKTEIIKAFKEQNEAVPDGQGGYKLMPVIFGYKMEAILDLDEEGYLFGITFQAVGLDSKRIFNDIFGRLKDDFGDCTKSEEDRIKKTDNCLWQAGDKIVKLEFEHEGFEKNNSVKLTYTHTDIHDFLPDK